MKVMETNRFNVTLKEFRVIGEGEMGNIEVVKDGLELRFSTLKVISPFTPKKGDMHLSRLILFSY